MAPDVAPDVALERYLTAWRELGPASVETLVACFADQGRFRDPFNDVRGADAIRRVLEHMFDSCEAVHFDVHAAALDGHLGFVHWTCRLRLARWPDREQVLRGVSTVRLDRAGRVAEHIDHWDAAEQVYERLPLLGALLRAVKRRLQP